MFELSVVLLTIGVILASSLHVLARSGRLAEPKGLQVTRLARGRKRYRDPRFSSPEWAGIAAVRRAQALLEQVGVEHDVTEPIAGDLVGAAA